MKKHELIVYAPCPAGECAGPHQRKTNPAKSKHIVNNLLLLLCWEIGLGFLLMQSLNTFYGPCFNSGVSLGPFYLFLFAVIVPPVLTGYKEIIFQLNSTVRNGGQNLQRLQQSERYCLFIMKFPRCVTIPLP